MDNMVSGTLSISQKDENGFQTLKLDIPGIDLPVGKYRFLFDHKTTNPDPQTGDLLRVIEDDRGTQIIETLKSRDAQKGVVEQREVRADGSTVFSTVEVTFVTPV